MPNCHGHAPEQHATHAVIQISISYTLGLHEVKLIINSSISLRRPIHIDFLLVLFYSLAAA
jgi:hypothetical protein